MSDTAKKSSAKSLWRNRNFLLLWSGQFVSWTGTEISGIALPLLVLALTGSPAQAGFIASIHGVAYVVWAIPAGVLIDRWNRRMVMVIANLGSGVAMGSISLALLFKHITILQLYVACAIEDSFFVFAISIFFINVPLQVERVKTNTSFREEIRAGIVWLWHEKAVRFLNVLTAGLYLLIIIIAKQHQASSGAIGLILAVGGAGGIAGSLCANSIHKRFRFHHILIATTTLSFLIFTLYFFAYNTIILAAITVALNVVSPIYEVTSFTYSVSVIPDRIRGRVTSITRLVVLG